MGIVESREPIVGKLQFSDPIIVPNKLIFGKLIKTEHLTNLYNLTELQIYQNSKINRSDSRHFISCFAFLNLMHSCK